MSEDFTSRSTLKQFFEKNKIPTEDQFGAFIDTSVNQADDGLMKEALKPLMLETGNNGNKARAMSFYNHFSDVNPIWNVDLNPSGTVDGGTGNAPGLAFVDENEVSRLFIGKSGSRRVGISTIQPEGQLHVSSTSASASPQFGAQRNNLSLVLGQAGTNNPGTMLLHGTAANEFVYQRAAAGNFFLDSSNGEYRFNNDPLLSNRDGVLRLYKKNSSANDQGSVILSSGGNSYFQNRLGIGTSNPTAPLEVQGQIKATKIFGREVVATSGYLHSSQASGESGLGLRLDYDSPLGPYAAWYAQGKRSFTLRGGKDTVRLDADQANIVAITGAKVGIGHTAPSYELDVFGRTRSEYLAVYKRDTANGNVASFTATGSDNTYVNWYHKSDRYLYIQAGDNKIARFHADKAEKIALTGGKVGIGTTSPADELEVAGRARMTGLNVIRTDAGGGWVGQFSGNANQGTYVNFYHKGKRSFYLMGEQGKVRLVADNADKIALLSGNVGIGTESPADLLDVAGTTRTRALSVIRTDTSGGGYTAQFSASTTEPTYVNWNHKGQRSFYLMGGTDYVRLHADKATKIGLTGGNVGIGTTAPRSTFTVQVSGESSWQTMSIGPKDYWGDGKTKITDVGRMHATLGAGDSGVMIYNAHIPWIPNRGAILRMGRGDGIASGHYYDIGVVAGNSFHLRNQSSKTTIMHCLSNGYVGLGTTAPARRLHVMTDSGGGHRYGIRLQNSSGSKYYWDLGIDNESSGTDMDFLFAFRGSLKAWIDDDGTYNKSSDGRLKANIEPLRSTLNQVMKLKPSTYHFKTNESKRTQIGLVAQDVQQHFPEVISEKEHLGMDYDALSVIAIKAIQEQQALITTLQAEIQALKANA